MVFVVYWEKSFGERGFVSYENKKIVNRDEYKPLVFVFATNYKTRKKAEKIRDWYVGRGGFGFFKVMEVKL